MSGGGILPPARARGEDGDFGSCRASILERLEYGARLSPSPGRRRFQLLALATDRAKQLSQELVKG